MGVEAWAEKILTRCFPLTVQFSLLQVQESQNSVGRRPILPVRRVLQQLLERLYEERAG